jgi:hypothetical protein
VFVMRPSTWLLLAVLVLLVGREPWLLDVVCASAAWALGQPAVLVVLAVGLLVRRARRPA